MREVLIKSLAVLAVIGNAAMLLVATISTTMTPTPAAATTGIGSDGGPISSVHLEGWPEETDALHYTTFAIRLLGVGDDGLTKPVASDARLNLVLIANLPSLFLTVATVESVTFRSSLFWNTLHRLEDNRMRGYHICSLDSPP